jgi:hypothetical protein
MVDLATGSRVAAAGSTASQAGSKASANVHGKHKVAPKARSKPDGRGARSPHSAKTAVPGDPPEPAARPKLVRDSFAMPKPEYSVLAELKLRAARLGRPIKKGELLRAGVAALRLMPDRPFLAALEAVPTLKPGRPTGSKSTSDETQRQRSKKHRKSS